MDPLYHRSTPQRPAGCIGHIESDFFISLFSKTNQAVQFLTMHFHAGAWERDKESEAKEARNPAY